MSKARGLADLGNVYNDGALSNRNLVINGAMQVAQRGTSSSPAPSGYLIDRFATFKGGSGVFALEQSSDAPAGFNKSLKVSVSSASTPSGGDYYIVQYPFEGQDFSVLGQGTSSAQSFTLSFYVKSSVTGTFSGSVRDGAATRSYVFEYTMNVINTWERKTVTITGNSSGTFPTDNTVGASLAFSLGQGTTYAGSTVGSWVSANYHGSSTEADFIANAGATWQITGVQLEVGDTATPFEHRSYGDELARCQRFCQRFGDGETNVLLGMAHTYTSGVSYGVLKYHNTMRAPPSATFSTNAAGTWRFRYGSNLNASNVAGATGIGADQFGKDQCRFYISTGTAADNNGWVRGQTDASYLILDAEL